VTVVGVSVAVGVRVAVGVTPVVGLSVAVGVKVALGVTPVVGLSSLVLVSIRWSLTVNIKPGPETGNVSHASRPSCCVCPSMVCAPPPSGAKKKVS
jgi:hypothetical protein